MIGVFAAIRETHPDATIFCPHLPYSFRLTRAQPELVAAVVVEKIDGLMHRGDHKRIVLVGYSMGSLIARKVAIMAHGERVGIRGGHVGAPFERSIERYAVGRPWADRIDRLVMLAGMARGWSLNDAGIPIIAALWGWIILFGEIAFNGGFLLLRTRKGAPFIVQTRLQWFALTQSPDYIPIQVVQLLGSQDNTVAPDDTIDFAVDVASKTFVLIELPNTDHRNAIVMDDGVNRERKSRFMRALHETPEDLRALDEQGKRISIPNILAVNGAAPESDGDVTHVVFVIHGIRDRGFWTRKIAQKVMEQASRGGHQVRAMTLSYGYMAMVPFVLPWVRRAKVRWMMDCYAEWRALYPKAEFFYVGHSNGTYLAARALKDYPAARFKRIVFAGSVVRRQYDWTGMITGRWGQVDAVMNYVASRDWVVAIFPNGLSRFDLFDLGSAGHHGFDQLAGPDSVRKAGTAVRPVPIGREVSYQIDYIAGGHGAGIRESQWDDIARFIAHGEPPKEDDADYVRSQAGSAIALAWMPPLSLAVIIAFAFLPGCCLFLMVQPLQLLHLIGWAVFMLYLLMLYIIVTRA